MSTILLLFGCSTMQAPPEVEAAEPPWFVEMAEAFHDAENLTFTVAFSTPADDHGREYKIDQTLMVFARDDGMATVDWIGVGRNGQGWDDQWLYDHGDWFYQRHEDEPVELQAPPVVAPFVTLALAALEGFPGVKFVELDPLTVGHKLPVNWQEKRAWAELQDLPPAANPWRVLVERYKSTLQPTRLVFQDRATGLEFSPSLVDISLDVPVLPNWFSNARPDHCFPPTVTIRRGGDGQLLNYYTGPNVVSCLPHYHGRDQNCVFRCSSQQSW